MDPTIRLDKPITEAIESVTQALDARAFRVTRSFDFREAAAAHAQCTCPYHETESCSCQYLMLIAYPEQTERGILLIAVHGAHNRTFISLIQGEESEWLSAMLLLAGESTE